jgi:pyruvate dehydrogenase E1 component
MNAPTPLAALADIDTDPQETAEWREAFLALAATEGPQRARFVLEELARLAREQRLGWQPDLNTPYLNSVSAEAQPLFPGDLALEERLASIMRWNALAMVVRANQAYGELGGHIASYASAADLFETGFHHFFHGREGLAPGQHRGDLVFFQPHSAPGVYARAFLEGRLDEQDLQHYRQEIGASAAGAQGLSSYPHPWLMPDFWQFPTGSMGIGPISSIYHARFMRYLTHRHLLDCQGRKVWGVFGDGEMDEPESMSALTLAAREGLDNLVWVVNCNLQRLDGPVRGNGRIVDELERLFAGAGWNVVKLLWGSDWDGLFARDLTGTLAQTLGATVDGQMQTFAAKDGRYNREHFFGQSPELAALAQGLTDEQIDRLKRGGHDLVKIHAAYAAAAAHRGQPTVILAHTKKGYGMGSAGQGKMTTHSQKKLDDADLIEFRNRFNLPLSDEQAKGLAFHKPAEDSAEMQYLRARRAALGGALPRRETVCDPVPVPPVGQYAQFALAPGGKEMSTTMAFVRMLGSLLKDAQLGPRIVPIVADEARTFGMANLFKQVGDAIWAAADQRARGFLLGATSGRTTLGGEGLQHQDGSSHLVAATIPNCKAWDPAHAGELAVILDAGMREMLIEQRDVFYYITLMNENYAQPDLPEGAAEGVLRGAYVFARLGDAGMAKSHVTLLGSGAILTEVLKAATQLASEGVAATVVSVTSWSELARDGVACEQRMLAGEAAGKPWIAQLLDGTQGPVVAATDYVRAVPEAVRAFLPTGRRFLTLGTDGFGRSDTRAALRGYFGVDARSVAQAARRLVQAG